MAIVGIGVDIVELPRIKQIIEKNPSFVKRVLTPNEYTQFNQLSEKRKVEYFGGRFACKEAFSKAWGTGIGEISFEGLEILNEPNGKPFVKQNYFDGNVFVSISHSEQMAVAQIILEK